MEWLSILRFCLRNWKLIVSFLTALAVGFGAAWFIQGVRVDMKEAALQKKQVEITALKKDLKDCQDANAANRETIEKLKAEVKSAHSLCKSRLGVKDETIARLRKIDALKGKKEVADEKGITAVDDPILRELNRMFINKADSKD